MLKLIQHPGLLFVSLGLCIPLMFPLARFFFDDFETFKQELGLGSEFDRSMWLLGCIPSSPGLYFKIVGFFGIYAGAVAATYQLLAKIFS